jgi:hypothetical protein
LQLIDVVLLVGRRVVEEMIRAPGGTLNPCGMPGLWVCTAVG